MTKQGLAILAGFGGVNPVVTAWAGTGTVQPDDLQEQTALVDAKQQLAVIEDGKADNKRYTRLQVVNDDISIKYELNQLGVFISFGGGKPVLYYIAQNPDGDIIPSNAQAKGFIAEYLTTLVFAIGDTVLYDSSVISGFITPDALDARLVHFRTQLDTFLDSRYYEIVSETEPVPDTCAKWFKPLGTIAGWNDWGNLSSIGAGGVTHVYLTGSYYGTDPPASQDVLWFSPIS